MSLTLIIFQLKNYFSERMLQIEFKLRMRDEFVFWNLQKDELKFMNLHQMK